MSSMDTGPGDVLFSCGSGVCAPVPVAMPRHDPLSHGFEAAPARFPGTHASGTPSGVTCEELLVSTADKIWKNKRAPELEYPVVTHLARASGRECGEEALARGKTLGRIGEGADPPLAHQASFPVYG